MFSLFLIIFFHNCSLIGRDTAQINKLNKLDSLETCIEKIEEKSKSNESYSDITATVAIVISLISIGFTLYKHKISLPRIIIEYDGQAAFFKPTDDNKKDKADWITISFLAYNKGQYAASIKSVEFNAKIGNEILKGFDANLIMDKNNYVNLPCSVQGGETKKLSFSFGMSGLGIAKAFNLYWRNLPPDTQYELVIKDSLKKVHSFSLKQNDFTVITHEDAESYNNVLRN